MTRKPLTGAEKAYLRRRKEAGATHQAVAEELGCSTETVKKWWRYERRGTPPRRRGRPAAGALSTYPAEVRATAEALKRAHPHWGPVTVRLKVQAQLDLRAAELPSASRLAALFRAVCPEAVKGYRRRQYPDQPPSKVSQPHQRWQMDGKEKVPVAEGQVATVLDIVDPYSGLYIAAQGVETTTASGWRKLTLAAVQTSLRAAFSHWGLPQQIQTDREVVYVGAPERYFPSLFSLWLVGLGIEHRLSRAKRPTDQAHVERSHRTLGDLVWQDTDHATLWALQHDLDETRQWLNEDFPSRAAHCHGQPPLQAHPQACHSGRPFHPALEWELFDLRRVDAYLAQQVWTRTVSETGTVSLAGQRYPLGRALAGQTVSVTFQPHSRTFLFATADGDPLTHHPARGLDQADLVGFIPTDDWPRLEQPFQLPLPFLRVV